MDLSDLMNKITNFGAKKHN